MALIISGVGKRVATSVEGGQKGAPKLVLAMDDQAGVDSTARNSAGAAAAEHLYTIRLHFAEPQIDARPGDRVFDVTLQGQPVIAGLDITAETGGPLRALVRTWQDIPAAGVVEIALTPVAGAPPVISGVELIRQDESR